MRRHWMVMGGLSVVALSGCAPARPDVFKPDIAVKGPPGHPPGQPPHARKQYWDPLDPFLPVGSEGAAPALLPGLAPTQEPKKRNTEFVIPDANVMFGRPAAPSSRQ